MGIREALNKLSGNILMATVIKITRSLNNAKVGEHTCTTKGSNGHLKLANLHRQPEAVKIHQHKQELFNKTLKLCRVIIYIGFI